MAPAEELRSWGFPLRDYFDRYIPLAKQAGVGFLLESLTWRASPG